MIHRLKKCLLICGSFLECFSSILTNMYQQTLNRRFNKPLLKPVHQHLVHLSWTQSCFGISHAEEKKKKNSHMRPDSSTKIKFDSDRPLALPAESRLLLTQRSSGICCHFTTRRSS